MENSGEKILIRQADASDAQLIAVLGAVTFYEAYFEQDDPPDLANYIAEAFAPEKILTEIENPNATFFIIYRNEKAVGYAKFRRDGERPAGVAENSIELQRIYVLERVFGKGVGERLLNHCLAAAKREGFEFLWLGVWEENRRARRFYEKHGFRKVGTLTFPYGETVGTNLVLQKNL
jgi:diamine N-acetyltransferase